MQPSHITLILGGARSGKSAIAEEIASGRGEPITYVATSSVDPTDTDFAARVAAHKLRRPPSWNMIEAGPDLAGELAALQGAVLVDSVGGWVARHAGFAVDAADLAVVVRARAGATIIVSEELGLGVHPSTHAGREFRDAVGAVNQVLAQVADDVLLVVAGRVLPLDRFDGVDRFEGVDGTT